MDLQFSNIDDDFIKILEMEGSFFKKLIFKNVIELTKEFYVEYIKWRNKNGKHIDFIQPLCWHLYYSGVSGWKIRVYLKNIASKIKSYINSMENNGVMADD